VNLITDEIIPAEVLISAASVDERALHTKSPAKAKEALEYKRIPWHKGARIAITLTKQGPTSKSQRN